MRYRMARLGVDTSPDQSASAATAPTRSAAQRRRRRCRRAALARRLVVRGAGLPVAQLRRAARRRATCRLVVVHSISLPPGEYGGDEVERLFTNRLDWDAHPYFESIRGLQVSAHFFIRRDGELLQFVSCDQRAWHAGASQWRGRDNCNDDSVGIELEGLEGERFEAAQYAQLAVLLRALAQRYPIAQWSATSTSRRAASTTPARASTGPGCARALRWSRARCRSRRRLDAPRNAQSRAGANARLGMAARVACARTRAARAIAASRPRGCRCGQLPADVKRDKHATASGL